MPVNENGNGLEGDSKNLPVNTGRNGELVQPDAETVGQVDEIMGLDGLLGGMVEGAEDVDALLPTKVYFAMESLQTLAKMVEIPKEVLQMVEQGQEVFPQGNFYAFTAEEMPKVAKILEGLPKLHPADPIDRENLNLTAKQQKEDYENRKKVWEVLRKYSASTSYGFGQFDDKEKIINTLKFLEKINTNERYLARWKTIEFLAGLILKGSKMMTHNVPFVLKDDSFNFKIGDKPVETFLFLQKVREEIYDKRDVMRKEVKERLEPELHKIVELHAQISLILLQHGQKMSDFFGEYFADSSYYSVTIKKLYYASHYGENLNVRQINFAEDLINNYLNLLFASIDNVPEDSPAKEKLEMLTQVEKQWTVPQLIEKEHVRVDFDSIYHFITQYFSFNYAKKAKGAYKSAKIENLKYIQNQVQIINEFLLRTSGQTNVKNMDNNKSFLMRISQQYFKEFVEKYMEMGVAERRAMQEGYITQKTAKIMTDSSRTESILKEFFAKVDDFF